MNRRDFLRRATTAAVGALVLDPERLLWVPGAKTVFDLGQRRPRFVVLPVSVKTASYFESGMLATFEAAPGVDHGELLVVREVLMNFAKQRGELTVERYGSWRNAPRDVTHVVMSKGRHESLMLMGDEGYP